MGCVNGVKHAVTFPTTFRDMPNSENEISIENIYMEKKGRLGNAAALRCRENWRSVLVNEGLKYTFLWGLTLLESSFHLA